MDKEQFAETARERFETARKFWMHWRVEAQQDYDFVSGKQWLDEDIAILNEQRRPPITFNYSEKMIDAVLGAEVGNRQEVTYSPRGIEDSPLAELWTNASKWVRDQNNAEEEESDSFKDALICGLGWTQTRLDYEGVDPDGMIMLDRVDPLEMYTDPAASKKGLTDRRYHFRTWWVDKDEARRNWPDADGFGEENNANTGVVRTGHHYEDQNQTSDWDRRKDQVQVRFYETYEMEDFYRAAGADGQIHELKKEEFAKAKKALDEKNIKYVKQRRKHYYQAYFAGETLLEMHDSPCQYGWMINCITAKRDRNKNTWYGLTRVMRDPQRWANKWLSQIMHIINTNAKGGLMAETNAFVDPVRAQEEWSSPDSITLLQEGGLNRIKEKSMAQYPQGLDRLMEFALGALPMVTGINLEALGLANRQQANVLEQSRKQAAYGLLAPLFDGLRQYRKAQGKVQLHLIQDFIADNRLVRIGGPGSEQFIQLTKQPNSIEFDVIVDQSPSAPDVKEQTWKTLQEILPTMMKLGLPIPPDLLKYAPVPAALAADWEKLMQQGPQIPDQVKQQMQQMQQQIQQLTDQNKELKSNSLAKQAELAQSGQKMQAEIQLKEEMQNKEFALEKAKAEAEFQLEQLKMDREFELEQKRLSHENMLQQKKTDGELRVKAIGAGIAAAGEEGGGGQVKLQFDVGPMEEAIKSIADSNRTMGENMNQSNQQMSEAVRALVEAISKPRKIIEDSKGKPIGSAVVNKL